MTHRLFWFSLIVVLSFSFRVQAAESFSFSSVAKLIKDKHLKSIDELLPLLPRTLRSHFVLVYNSHSLQKASPLFPRVILYGEDAKLLLAFNGNPDRPGYSTLEAIEYDTGAKGFSFYEVHFPKPGEAQTEVSEPQKNLRSCTLCHHESLRPNWESYNVWPGVYGSHVKEDVDLREEMSNFREFVKTGAKEGRYRFLEEMDQKFQDGLRYNHEPASEMTAQLAKWNWKRVAHIIRTSEHYKEFKYAIGGVLGRCEFSGFLPESIERGMTRTYSEVEKETRAFLKKSAISTFESDDDNVTMFAGLRYLFEGRGKEIASWSMTFQGAAYSMTTPDLFGYEGLLAALHEEDSDLWAVKDDGLFSAPCDELRKKSLESLKTLLAPSSKP